MSNLSFSVPANAKPGTYYLGLWSDRSNVVSESNESNNISTVMVMVGGDASKLPDLKPLNVQTNSKSVAPGSTVFVTGTAQNAGSQSAGAFIVRWVLSKNASVDAGDTPLKTISKSSLAAGAQTTLNTSLVIPKTTAPGTYYLGVWVDASNSVVESNEANNTSSFLLSISSSTALADLTNQSGKLSPTTVKAGSSVIYIGAIKNSGTQNAGPFKVEWWLSTNSVISTSDKNLKSLSKSSLGAGQSTSASSSIVIPATTKPGTYYLAAWIDRANAVSESNTVNNKLVLKLTVTGASSPLPDLTATSGKLSKVSAKAGETVLYTGVVKNQGQANSGTYAVEWRWSTNSAITTIDKLLKSSTRPSIQGGSSQTVLTSLQIPANTAAGTYYVGVWIDRLGQVQESDETNNIQVLTITVTQGGTTSKLPDLTNVNGKVNSATIAAGKTLVYTGAVRNQGASTAAGSEVEWRLSTNTAITTLDKLLGTRTLGSLAAGGSTSSTKALVIPANTAPGTYYLGVWIDRKGAVQESDETNNIETIKLTVTSNSSKQPDLVHVAPKLSNTFVVAGASLSFKGSINNQGSSNAGSYQVAWRLTKSATFSTSAPLLKILTKPSLTSGATTSNLTTLTVPVNTGPGAYYVAVMLDSGKKIAESSESNNYTYLKITVIAKSTASKPDLVHDGAKLSSASATTGGIVVYQGSIKNIGNDKAPSFVVEYRLSSDTVISAADTLLSTKTVAGLPAGSSVSAQVLLKIPSDTKPGAYTVGIWLDPKGKVNESQKANNIAKVALKVLGTATK
ncbi:MAG TPA: hypothetical protein DCQ06_00760 [Myxococcales bacterium]|nr:hypothetical protein [Myxococcales bacterium]